MILNLFFLWRTKAMSLYMNTAYYASSHNLTRFVFWLLISRHGLALE